jgi:hypothetical protein
LLLSRKNNADAMRMRQRQRAQRRGRAAKND